MKREREPIPKPRSSFLLIKCPDCGEERIAFSSSTKEVSCKSCGRKLAQNTGGKILLLAPVVKKLD
jgi:small subunit ribosomal protein S27e